MPDYQYIEDFVSDDLFQKWVLLKDEDADIYWKKYIEQNPEKEEIIFQAVKLVQSLNFAEQLPSEFQEKKVWEQIQQELHTKNTVSKLSHKLYPSLWLAASITIILGLGVWFGLQLWQSDMNTLSTAYGEVREIYLPDSSLVTLNGNSSLIYPRNWDEEADREVWLKGEGYFEVKKLQTKANKISVKFTVHTSKLNVEVLGTAFNVSDRKDKTDVVLTEGSIVLKIKHEAPVQMKPGERFAIQGDSLIHETKLNDLSKWSSWKEKELIFQKQSLSEIAIQLKNVYGYQLIFPSDEIAREKFTARMHSNDVELLFPLIARSFNLTYTVQDKVIKFESYK